MKSSNRSQYVVALAVIGCSLALLAALTIALSGQRWGAGGRTLEIEFTDVTGVKLHSDVRYAGAVAGSVADLRYLTPEERARAGKGGPAVRITARLNRDAPPIPRDTLATISSETLLGEKFIALSAGTPGVEPLRDRALIQGQSMSGFESLTLSLEKTAAAATELLAQIKKDYPELLTNLSDSIISGGTLLDSATNVVSEARLALGDVRETWKKLDATIAGAGPQVSNLLAETTATMTNINPTLNNTRDITEELHEFLTNQFLVNLDQNMRNLTGVLTRTELTLEYVKILAARLAEKPSRLIWQMRPNPVPDEAEVRQTLPSPAKLP